ncbi:MAG: hypothetical protein AAGF71_08870 [Pseudomonadota bacterium]
MFLELIATFVAGFAAAGTMMAVHHLTGQRLPRWTTPTAAGAVMIFVAIWSEYTWYDRTVNNLPDGLAIADVDEVQQFYRPWTYIAPMTNQFSAVDVGTMRTNDDFPDKKIADVYVMGRWRAVTSFPVLFDCGGNRRGLMSPEVDFTDEGDVTGVLWADVTTTDPMLSAACSS